jgi:CHAT domain-containing protein
MTTSNVHRCPEPEVLASFVDGGATTEEIRTVMDHIETCSDCLEFVCEAAHVKRELVVKTAPRRSHTVLARAGIAAAIVLATSSILFVAYQHSTARNPWSKLVSAAGETPYRPVDGRLTGFPYRAVAIANRGDETIDGTLARVRQKAGEVLDTLSSRKMDDPHLAGVASLLAGKSWRAEALLTVAAERTSGDPRVWNDLAVARLAASRDRDQPQTLPLALAAADRAIRIDPTLPEPLFNRALILQEIGLDSAAMRAFAQYVRHDEGSDWTTEATRRQEGLRKPSRQEEWKARIAALESAASRKDDAAVLAIVSEYRQESRTYGEAIVLANWAAATGQAAQQQLQLASAIGRALVRINGESLLNEAVAAIQKDPSPARMTRLATAHRTYYQAGSHYGRREIEVSLPLFEEADRLFRETGSPMAGVTSYYIASCEYDFQKTDEALRRLGALIHATPERYRALHALLLWETGTAYQRTGALVEALEANRRALALFTEIGEVHNANSMHSAVASCQALLGRRNEAWRERQTYLRQISATGDAINLQRALDASARTEALDGHWEESLALFSVALEPGMTPNPRVHVASLLWHALAAHRLQEPTLAGNDLAAARRAMNTIPEGRLRDRARAELMLVEASLLRDRDPAGARTLLDRYVDDAMRTGTALLLPEVRLERARASRVLGRTDLAEADLRETLRLLNERTPESQPELLRDGYFRTRETAIRELVDLLEAGDPASAFRVVDEARALPYGTRPHRPTPPAGTAILEYVVLPDRLVLFVLDSNGVRAHRTNVGEAEVGRLCDAFVAAVQQGSTSASGFALARVLFGPVHDEMARSSRITIVADGALTRVPFAALPGPDGRGYLVESHEIVAAPASSLALREGSATVSTRDLRVIAIGNPRFSRKYFPALADLPAAEAEAVRVAKLYPRSRLMTGSDATREAVLQALSDADIVEIAAHGVTVDDDPARSHLVLADMPGDSGALYLKDIVRTKPDQLVVLAGCRTGSAPAGRRNVPALAGAFLAAGAGNVLGTIWSVEDQSAAHMAMAFHQQLASGAAPAAALRGAQLAMIRSNSIERRKPSGWSAFQLYGSGTW